MGVHTDFGLYREAYDGQPMDQHSLETFGINNEHAFELAATDPRSAIANWADGAIPILTPLTNLQDRNFALYRRLAEETVDGPIGAMGYFSHVASRETYDANVITAMAPIVRAIAASRGLFVYDAARESVERTDAEIVALLQTIGGITCELVDGMPEHYHYVMKLSPPQTGPAYQEREMDLVALFPDALADGALEENDAIQVVGTLPAADREHVASYYAPRHAELTQHDATDAGFGPESLQHVLSDPRYVKIAYRVGGHVANLSILADPRDCPWIDQIYLREGHPEHYDQGRILVGIGAISDPDVTPGLALGTFNVIRRLIAYAGGNAVLAIATDDVSNQYIPRMSIGMLRGAGLDPRPVDAVTGVVFRSLVLHPQA